MYCSIKKKPLTRQRFIALFGGIGQQGHNTGSFDGFCQAALMFGAVAGYTAGQDFTPFRNEFPQLGCILVVDIYDFVHTKNANPFTPPAGPVAPGAIFPIASFRAMGSFIIRHFYPPL